MKTTDKQARPSRPAAAAKRQAAQSTLQRWWKVRERIRELKAAGLCKEMERTNPNIYRLGPMSRDISLNLQDRTD